MDTFKSEAKINKRNILIAIPILFFIGIPIHFLYALSGGNNILGAIVPVNESVFEHCKLTIVPLILWWTISYYILRRKTQIDYKKWFFSGAISTVIAPIVIITFYYAYTGAFGVSILIIDILSLLLALMIGQCMALHIYKYIRTSNEKFYIGIVIILLIIIFTIYLTYYPAHIPLFEDSITGLYGIK